MGYKVKLIKGLSYNGIVYADKKNPIVEVETEKELENVLATGHFELVGAKPKSELSYENTLDSIKNLSKEQQEAIIKELVGNQDDKAEDDIEEDDVVLYTQASLKKINKAEQEAIITQLGGNPEESNNESERIDLILKLQGE